MGKWFVQNSSTEVLYKKGDHYHTFLCRNTVSAKVYLFFVLQKYKMFMSQLEYFAGAILHFDIIYRAYEKTITLINNSKFNTN